LPFAVKLEAAVRYFRYQDYDSAETESMRLDNLASVSRFLATVVLFALRVMDRRRRRSGRGKIAVNVNLVLVDATKVQGRPNHVPLKKEDLRCATDGVAQNVEVFSRDELPVNVARCWT